MCEISFHGNVSSIGDRQSLPVAKHGLKDALLLLWYIHERQWKIYRRWGDCEPFYPTHNTLCWHFDGNLFSSPASQTISIMMLPQLRIQVVNWVIAYSNSKTLKKLALWKPIGSLIWLFLLLDLRVCINDYLFFMPLLHWHIVDTKSVGN